MGKTKSELKSNSRENRNIEREKERMKEPFLITPSDPNDELPPDAIGGYIPLNRYEKLLDQYEKDLENERKQ